VGYGFYNDGDTGMYQLSNNNLGFATLGENRLTIDSTGNVGIGTTSPQYGLDIKSSEYVGARIESTSNGYAPASLLLESGHADSRGQGIYQYNSVSKNSWFSGVPYSTTSDDWVIAHKLETTAFNSDVAQMGNALFCVNDNGNVGIGANNPRSTLEVDGQVLISNTAPYLDFVDTNSFSDVNDRFRVRAGGDQGLMQWYDDSSDNLLTLMTLNSNGDVIVPNGNVGIGKSSPAAKLDVISTANGFEGVIQAKSTYASSSYFSAFRSAPSDGSTTANAGLWMGAISNDNATISSGAIYRSAGQWRPADSTASIISMSSGSIGFSTNSGLTGNVDYVPSIRMTIASSGNVGIGTNDPTADLHVQGSSATDVPIIRSGGYGNSGSKLELAETLSSGEMNYGYSFFNDGNSSNTLQIKNHNNSTTGNIAMSIVRQNGNVGINVASAGEKLEVNGTVKAQGYKSSDGTAGITGTMSFVDKDSVTRTITYKNGLVVGTTPAPPS
jgi:hypothetical protein